MTAKRKKLLNGIFTALLLAFAVFAAVTLVFAIVVRFRGGNGIFGYGFYQIVSGSMEPEIKVGDVVVAKKAVADEVNAGDTIVFSYQGKIVTHRLIEKQGDYLITKGIANTAAETVPATALIAVQVGRLPGFGYVLDFLRTPYGYVLLIGLPLAGVLVYQTTALTKALKKKKEPDSEREEIAREIAELKNKLENGETPYDADPKDQRL